ncbi:hypothetical protein TRM7557_01860 [Tritonibacter multivorans]|uniref:Uncharacterized protein n=1 Tax=Tritonibacter multivorans TaxID=928856 RepID=A0A0P1GWK6_9RHOB|nr:hypothetical protein TRM7557_01860 [Tritonibacter multivorans]
MPHLHTLLRRLRDKIALKPDQAELLATIKFPCC